MKAIPHVLALLAACGAAFFSFQHSGKFAALQEERIATVDSDKKKTADLAATNSEIKTAEEALAAAQEKQSLGEQALSAAKTAGTALKRESTELDAVLKTQEEENVELEKALAEVGEIVKGMGDDVTIDNLGDKIQEIDADRTAKQTKLEELETLATASEKSLAASRAEQDSLVKKKIERNARIGRNSMEAVITAVNQDWGFVVIGAGSNSGFTPQTSLLVKRDNQLIGRVRPSSVEATQTIAEIDLKSVPAGARLQPGDRVMLATPATN